MTVNEAGRIAASGAARDPEIIETGGTVRLHLALAATDYDHLRDLHHGMVRVDGIYARGVRALSVGGDETAFGGGQGAQPGTYFGYRGRVHSGASGNSIAGEYGRDFGNDLFPFGLRASRKTLGAFCSFAHSQAVTLRHLSPRIYFHRRFV